MSCPFSQRKLNQKSLAFPIPFMSSIITMVTVKCYTLGTLGCSHSVKVLNYSLPYLVTYNVVKCLHYHKLCSNGDCSIRVHQWSKWMGFIHLLIWTLLWFRWLYDLINHFLVFINRMTEVITRQYAKNIVNK